MTISLSKVSEIKFYPNRDIIFNYGPALEQHAKWYGFFLYKDRDENLCATQTYFQLAGVYKKTIKRT